MLVKKVTEIQDGCKNENRFFLSRIQKRDLFNSRRRFISSACALIDGFYSRQQQECLKPKPNLESKIMPLHRTEFLKVVNDCVILVDVHTLDPEHQNDVHHVDLCTEDRQWFTDRHLQEVIELLRVPLSEYVKGVSSSKQAPEVASHPKGTAMKTPLILTGTSVRLIYKLKKRKHNYCILQNKENAEMLGTDYTRVYPEKVSVFVLPILPKSPAPYKQLLSAVGIKRSRVDISWYFTKGQPSTGSSQVTSSDQNLSSDRDSRTKSDQQHAQQASHSEQDKGQQRKTLRKIMKKADSRIAKQKKVKRRKRSTDITPDAKPSISQQTTSTCGGDEGTESDTLSGVSEIPHSHSEKLSEMSSEPDCRGVNLDVRKSGVVSHRIINLKSESTAPADMDNSTDFELPSLNSGIEIAVVDRKLPDTCAAELEEADDNISGNMPCGKASYVKQESAISLSKPKTDSHVKHKDKPGGTKSRRNICDNLLSAENTKDVSGEDVEIKVKETVDTENFLLAPRACREKDAFLKLTSVKSPSASSKPRSKLRSTGVTKEHIDSEETTNSIAKIMPKDRQISKGKSKHLPMAAGINQQDKLCVKDKEEDDDDLVIVAVTKSENPSGSKEKPDYKRVRNLSHDELKEIVKKNESYLRAIFQGKSYCGRHQDYKAGGKKREKLMFQMFVGEFTDEQAMAVMDALRDMFCSRHDKYFDYVMRVLVAEVFVKIYMDMFLLSYKAAESAIIMPMYSKRDSFLDQTNDHSDE